MTNTQIERKIATQKISLQILVLVAQGKKLPEAVDEVLGAGTYETLAGEVYEALRQGA